MPFKKILATATVFAVLGAGAALAQSHGGPKIYAYHSQHNYCPAGLQPVTMDGVICCGRPNQGISYQQALAHPVKKRVKHVRHVRQSSCPVGTKGCTYD
ncbi:MULTISPECIES: hypothetical protein [Roseobacteraceae]|uniref:hypothetical protein n=1 Tax=Roseobacteraceae TaxID=2854170 RepID=UPI001C47F8DF|nr:MULTISPECIES: hypothetical protein [Roseobacteraceae]MBV7408886.1 hypothetical protein [Maritimibacter sp. DP1N21-5]MBY5934427.1 hypothetical protein [Tateyamaria omphalii]